METCVDRLPPGAETASNVPFPLHGHLCIAFDQTQDQVQTILGSLKPNFIFFDFSLWMPALACQIRSKAVYYSVITPVAQALKSKGLEIAQLKVVAKDLGTGMSIYVRITSSVIWSDAMALRTNHEVEEPYCDYLRKHYAKPVLLTGPVLPETPATKLDEKWTNWLCNFKQVLQMVAQQLKKLFQRGLKSVKGRGWVYGGWVPQTLILEHPSIGFSVTHCGYGSMWESLFSDCQIVCVPYLGDQILCARLMVEELKVAVEVEREDNGWISKESLSKAIISVMDEDSEIAGLVKYNHAKLKEELTSEGMQERYLDTFIQNLQGLLD
uniref:Uncharacterized protein n=1 Tax=Quercus lobata TaxID=97700 RepID=A0A7N2LFR1_QUELO